MFDVKSQEEQGILRTLNPFAVYGVVWLITCLDNKIWSL